MGLEGATIALVVSWSGQYYAQPILRGIKHVLSAAGARVVALTGDQWSATPHPRNVIYDLLDRRTFDGGIVLGGTLFHEQNSARHFRTRYVDLPLVSIGADLSQCPSVMADNACGVREAVLHLAALGRRRIAFVRGPTGNTDAGERYRGYREGLEQAGLPIDPDLIAPGAFVLLSGTKAVDLLLDERGASPDAIIAANDESARGVMEALQRRGVLVPEDVAVIGFDDVADAELCRPKLTTVAQPLVEQGVQAALLLGRMLGGDDPGPRLTLHTQLVYRDSCGGRERAAACPALGVLSSPDQARAWAEESFPRLWPWLRQRAGWTSLDTTSVRDAAVALLDVRGSAAAVDEQLEAAVRRSPLGEGWRWFRGLEDLNTALVGSLAPALRPAVAQAIERAKRIVNEVIIADRVRENHRATRELDFMHALTRDLLAAPQREAMLESLRLNLATHPTFVGSHLALHDDDPSWSRLIMSSKARDASLERSVRFPTRTVLPQVALPQQHAATMCAAPLSDGQLSHGTLVVEAPLSEALAVARIADKIAAWLNVRAAAKEHAGSGPHRVEVPEHIGNYPVQRRVGSGGMATVYLAETRVAGIPRPVALKLLHPHLHQDRMWCEQFVEEARVTAAIRHPNVVQLLELGEHAGGMFLVMDYVDGLNLNDLWTRALDRRAPLPLRISGRILVDALGGLAAAHDLRDADGFPVNLVHRDVSLQNILVGRDGVTRITDFGIARRSSGGKTETGVVKGKLRYMSPEQATGSPLDARADVWSMGVVAWELLAAKRMYGDRTDAEIICDILLRPPPNVSSIAPVPEALAKVVSAALTMEASERLPSALEFRTALIHAYRDEGGLADSEEVGELVRGLLMDDSHSIAPPARAAQRREAS